MRGSRTRQAAVLAAGTLAALLCASAHAAPCPVDGSVGGVAQSTRSTTAEKRLAYIRAQSEVGARRALGWSIGWGVTYGAAMVVQLSVAPFVDSDTRKDLYVGAFSGGIGALTRAIMVPKVVQERRRLRRRDRDPSLDPCTRAQAAERGMVRAARSEARGRSLFIHAASLVYNTGIGLFLALALDRPLSGIRQATIGATVAQVLFLTQPMTMSRALDRYRSGLGTRLTLFPVTLPAGGGVGLALRW